jgi:hypothetical protein
MSDTDTRSFAERMRDQSAQAWGEQQARDRRVGDIVAKPNNRSERWTNVIEIAAPHDGADATNSGAYVVEVTPNRLTDDAFGKVTYATVVGGADDRVRFYTVDMALLHAVARRAGMGDARGDAAFFAGRVLGITDTPA